MGSEMCIRDRYDAVWQVGVVLGVVAAVLHAPINEAPLSRAVKVAS